MSEHLINRETIIEGSILREIKEKTDDTIKEIDEEHDDEENLFIKDALNMAKKWQYFMMCREDGKEFYVALTNICL